MTCTDGVQVVECQTNTYNIRAREAVDLQLCLPNPITLTSQDPQAALPNPRYLAIHASCCRVAKLSGAADYLDRTSDPDDEGVIKVLVGLLVSRLVLSPVIWYCIMYEFLVGPSLYSRVFRPSVASLA
jgi:hypothetical protein